MDKLYYVQLLDGSRPVLRLTPEESSRVFVVETGQMLYVSQDSTVKFVATWLGTKEKTYKKVHPAYYGPTVSLEEVFELNNKNNKKSEK